MSSETTAVSTSTSIVRHLVLLYRVGMELSVRSYACVVVVLTTVTYAVETRIKNINNIQSIPFDH